jgi:hypothetical protein
MQRELKQQKLLESKAAAYDSIVRLRACTDSHRNFHRLVLHVIAGVRDFEKQLALAPTTASEQFPCGCGDPNCGCVGKCLREASCQVELCTAVDSVEPEFTNVLMCDLCANFALHRGTARLVEESCPETEQN